MFQGRRRVFKSGPAMEIIEYRRHGRGESTRGGLPLSLVGLGGLSREKIEFLALLCGFLTGFLCVWDQISVTIFC